MKSVQRTALLNPKVQLQNGFQGQSVQLKWQNRADSCPIPYYSEHKMKQCTTETNGILMICLDSNPNNASKILTDSGCKITHGISVIEQQGTDT